MTDDPRSDYEKIVDEQDGFDWDEAYQKRIDAYYKSCKWDWLTRLIGPTLIIAGLVIIALSL